MLIFTTDRQSRNFNAKIRKDPGGCWVWTAYRDKLGYGRFNIKNTPKLAHRIAWANHHGEEIPDGLSVMHLCNNQGCVNPDHLRVGTHAENIRMAFDDGLVPRPSGEAHYNSKLTADDVREIRRLLSEGTKQADLARRYGISQGAISNIKHRRNWVHI